MSSTRSATPDFGDSGDDAPGTPFHQMDPWLLRRAIALLEEQGKAALFEGATSDAEGVKFFSA